MPKSDARLLSVFGSVYLRTHNLGKVSTIAVVDRNLGRESGLSDSDNLNQRDVIIL
jgi:hypothetical protein